MPYHLYLGKELSRVLVIQAGPGLLSCFYVPTPTAKSTIDYIIIHYVLDCMEAEVPEPKEQVIS